MHTRKCLSFCSALGNFGGLWVSERNDEDAGGWRKRRFEGWEELQWNRRWEEEEGRKEI
jgi:hypothetical protein